MWILRLYTALVFVLGLSLTSQQLCAQANILSKKLEEQAKVPLRDAKNEAKFYLQEQKEAVKGSARDATTGGLKSGVSSMSRREIPKPKMVELIEDPNTREEIEDRRNQRRFVRLLGEWWALPSDADLQARAELKARLDALRNIDSSQYRINRLVPGTKDEVIIFGWHLASHGTGLVSAYNYNRLTAVSYYSYDINPETGEPRNPEEVDEFKKGEFTATVKEKGSFALLSVACDGEESTDIFLDWRNELARRTLTDSLIRMLAATGSDGIELHFPNVPEYRREDFLKFVKVLSMSLRAIERDSVNPANRYRILLSVPAHDTYNVYDISLLEPYVDYFVVLGYNFHRQPDGTVKKMPVAPLNYNPVDPNYDLRAAVEKYLGNIGRAKAGRLILALPLYGSKWETRGAEDELIELMSYMDIKMQPIFQDSNFLRIDSMKTSLVWDFIDTTGMSEGIISTQYNIFYDDLWSLERKYNYIIDARLGGVGFWALGHAIGFAPLDSLLDERFSEFYIEEDDKLAALKEGTNRVIRFGSVALAILFFWSIFMACGFCIALIDVRSRQALFVNGRFRMLYLGFFTLLLVVIAANLGLFEGTSPSLIFGVLLGSLLSWLALKLLLQKQAKQP